MAELTFGRVFDFVKLNYQNYHHGDFLSRGEVYEGMSEQTYVMIRTCNMLEGYFRDYSREQLETAVQEVMNGSTLKVDVVYYGDTSLGKVIFPEKERSHAQEHSSDR